MNWAGLVGLLYHLIISSSILVPANIFNLSSWTHRCLFYSRSGIHYFKIPLYPLIKAIQARLPGLQFRIQLFLIRESATSPKCIFRQELAWQTVWAPFPNHFDDICATVGKLWIYNGRRWLIAAVEKKALLSPFMLAEKAVTSGYWIRWRLPCGRKAVAFSAAGNSRTIFPPNDNLEVTL